MAKLDASSLASFYLSSVSGRALSQPPGSTAESAPDLPPQASLDPVASHRAHRAITAIVNMLLDARTDGRAAVGTPDSIVSFDGDWVSTDALMAYIAAGRGNDVVRALAAAVHAATDDHDAGGGSADESEGRTEKP